MILTVDSATTHMKATEQYFAVVFFIMLNKVVLTLESMDEILKCDHSNESYWAVFSCSTVYYALQGGSNFWVCGWNPSVTIQMKATEQCFPAVLFITLYKVVLTFEYVDEILKCDHSNESYWGVPLLGKNSEVNQIFSSHRIWNFCNNKFNKWIILFNLYSVSLNLLSTESHHHQQEGLIGNWETLCGHRRKFQMSRAVYFWMQMKTE